MALAATLRGEVTERSEHARYEIWVATSLDLADPEQPRLRVPIGDDGIWEAEFPVDAPFWLFLHQRFQPEGGPPVELFLPVELLPFTADPGFVAFPGVDPELVFVRKRLDTAMPAFGKWLLAVLIVFGSGFGLRFLLRAQAAPEGRRSAAAAVVAAAPPPSTGERRALLALLAVALALRLRGMASQALDLLEISYLPGIGRPAQFAGGASGLNALRETIDELARLYCIDLVHPPLYHAVMGVFGLFGDAEWLVRLPGLAASLTTGWLLWVLLRRWSPGAGLAAVAAFAVASPAIYFGQDGTPYALVGLVAVASLELLMRALERGTTRAWLHWFALIVAGFFCHYNVAQLAVGELATIVVLVAINRADRRWLAALHRGLKPALWLAPLPVGWAWIHFSTFPTIAQDTRLVADTYAPDPGFASFLWDFTQVTAGLTADAPLYAAIAGLLLFALGLHRAVQPDTGRPDRPPRALGITIVAVSIFFFLSVGFFYVNVKGWLGGKVFYAFRWVGWFHPVMLGMIALGAVRGLGPRLLRAGLAAVWLVGLGAGTIGLFERDARPDYEGASAFILGELADRDGIATLPAWFQRGNLSHYLLQQAQRVERLPEEGEGVWVLDGKRLVIEAIHPSLPFESTARSTHFKRLWVAQVEEQMSGRAKFSKPVADQALAWADEHLEPDGEWAFERIRLKRYRIPADLELQPGESLVVTAADTIMNWRTYPPLHSTGRPTFVDPASIDPREHGLGRTSAYHAPTSPGCVDWAFEGLPPEMQPDAPSHWYLELRFPVGADERLPVVEALTPAQVYARREGDALRVSAAGMPCTETPLRLRVTAPRVPPDPSTP